MGDLWRRSASDLVRAYASGETNPQEVVAELAERIDAIDPSLGAFTTLTLDRAMEEAARQTAELAHGRRRGPLHGVPIAIKELFDVGGAVTTLGSTIFLDRVPVRDAEAVRRLRAAGAIVLGLTRSHEFGWGVTTQHATRGGTRNPWNLDRVPGGSSGGSAAAVAAGLVPVALGSDTGGSIRIPAAFCGICGIKPTHGRVNTRGALALAPSLDHVGPLARDVDDCALLLSVLVIESWQQAPVQVKGLRVGVSESLQLPALAPDHASILQSATEVLRSEGALIRDVTVKDAGDIRPTFARIQMAEAYDVHSRMLGTFPGRSAEYGADVRGRLEDAARVTMPDYFAARQRAGQLREDFEGLFQQIDVLITPVAAGGPSPIASPDTGTHNGKPMALRDLILPYTVPQDLFGLPACAVRAGFARDGMPVGIQITAPARQEFLALSVGGVIHAALGDVARWPAIALDGG